MTVYEGREPYIFISYSHKDSHRVLPVVEHLQAQGFRVWYDAGIEAGSEWPEYIAEHLENSACVIAFISAAAMASHNCRREIHFAIDLKKPPMAVYLEDVTLSPGMRMQLGPLQALFRRNYSSESTFYQALSQAKMLHSCLGRPEAPQVYSTSQQMPSSSMTAEEYYQMGISLYNAQQTHEALPLLRRAAQMGHIQAQSTFGNCCLLGKGVAKDPAEAVKWYRLAAEQGDISAQFKLGNAYAQGNGAVKNLSQAAFWYRKAAAQGHQASMKALKNMGADLY